MQERQSRAQESEGKKRISPLRIGQEAKAHPIREGIKD